MSTPAPAEHSRPPTRPERSEAYWQTAQYAIVGVALLMVVVLVLAVIVLLGAIR